jgi:uncharacterized membrane protein YhdT
MSRLFFSRLRTALFFTGFSLVCFAVFLYALGSSLGFTDRTQFFLLNTILYAGLFIAFYALLSFVFRTSFTIVTHKDRVKAQSFIFFLLGIVYFIFSAPAAVILVLSKGSME